MVCFSSAFLILSRFLLFECLETEKCGAVLKERFTAPLLEVSKQTHTKIHHKVNLFVIQTAGFNVAALMFQTFGGSDDQKRLE